jgi:hypothetical protein
MDDERWEPGMPVLDRQPASSGTSAPTAPRGPVPHHPPSLARLPPRSVPETEPTRLQKQFIPLSVIVFVCGAVAITALELGATFSNLLVKACVLVGAPILVVTTADAAVRIWRSAWAWMPVDATKGLFRLTWLVPALVLIALAIGSLVVVLPA